MMTLIEALDREYSTGQAAATVLGSFGPRAKAAVPALMKVVANGDDTDGNWSVKMAAARALGQIGPDARVAIPALKRLIDKTPNPVDGMPEVVIALYHLAPDGSQIAESWLKKPFSARPGDWIYRGLANRSIVLAAMGRTSLEGDIATRHDLESLESMALSGNPLDDDLDYLEERIETIGLLGVGARLAVTWVKELEQQANPWVRMWAAETLEKIEPGARANGH